MLHEVATRVAFFGLSAVSSCAAASAPAEPAVVLIPGAPPPPVTSVGSARAGHPEAPGVRAGLPWETGNGAARARARKQRRPMLVYLRAEWSAASLALERELWSDPAVVEAAAGFVDLKVDVSSAEGDAELLARFYDAQTIPTTIVIDAEGTRVTTLVGQFARDELLVAMRAARAAP